MRMITPNALDPARRSNEATAFEQVLGRNPIWNCEHATDDGVGHRMDGNSLACDLHRSLLQSEREAK